VHEEWTDRLSDYLDGDLPDEERRAVDAHLRSCAECHAVLNDLKRVVAQAQALAAAPRPPAADLWAEIAARIDSSRRGGLSGRSSLSRWSAEGAAEGAGAAAEHKLDGALPFGPRVPRRIVLTLPQLAAAAVVVAAVSGGIVWEIAGRPKGLHYINQAEQIANPKERAANPADSNTKETESSADLQVRRDSSASLDATDRVVPVAMADAQYDAAVSDLEKAVRQGRGRLDAATIAIVEHNLQIIDQAIDQAREALAVDPANSYLSGHLVEARRRKLDLLRRAAALTDSN
jgi:hypothetical protein